MPFEEHEEFLPPPNPEATIWRYMDLAKFLSLLDKSSLFFVRVDKLAAQDPFEGYYTNLNVRFDTLKFSDTSEEFRNQIGVKDEKSFDAFMWSKKLIREYGKGDRERTFVNSWHAQEQESAAMWSLYVKSNEGIAIESTYERLVSSFAEYDQFGVHVGMVKYIDYQTDLIPYRNGLLPFITKRLSFEHEKELRALIWTPEHGKNDMAPGINRYGDHAGLYVPVNLTKLIKRILVAPTAPHWMLELLESLVKKFDLELVVVQSDLASTPIY